PQPFHPYHLNEGFPVSFRDQVDYILCTPADKLMDELICLDGPQYPPTPSDQLVVAFDDLTAKLDAMQRRTRCIFQCVDQFLRRVHSVTAQNEMPRSFENLTLNDRTIVSVSESHPVCKMPCLHCILLFVAESGVICSRRITRTDNTSGNEHVIHQI